MPETYDWLGLQGKICVVTGAARGIGASVAKSFAAAGAKAVIVDLEQAACETLCRDIKNAGGQALALAVDVSNANAVRAAAERVAEVLGPADVLVNNAGIVAPGAITDVKLDAWSRVMEVNVNGPLLCAQAFGAQMLERGKGAMVHVASLSGLFPQPYSGAYSVSKAGLAMLSEIIAFELGPKGIRSNAVSPGSIRTPLSAPLFENEEIVRKRQGMIPVRRFGEPQDIADAVLFLASDRSSYINGQNIVVDGGYSGALMGLLPRPGFEAPKE